MRLEKKHRPSMNQKILKRLAKKIFFQKIINSDKVDDKKLITTDAFNNHDKYSFDLSTWIS